MRSLFLAFFPYLYFLMFPPLAGYAEEGELFGYRLGGVYKPTRNIPDEMTDAIVYLDLTRSARALKIHSISAQAKVPTFMVYQISGTSNFKEWDKAKTYASNLGRRFLDDYGGEYWDVLTLEQEPKNDGFPEHVPRFSVVYEQVFVEKYRLSIVLMHGDRIFSENLSDPYVRIELEDINIEMGEYVDLGAGDE